MVLSVNSTRSFHLAITMMSIKQGERPVDGNSGSSSRDLRRQGCKNTHKFPHLHNLDAVTITIYQIMATLL